MKNLKPKYIFVGAIIIAVASIFIYAAMDKAPSVSYEDQLIEARKDRDEVMRSADSPLKDKKNFQGINYYKPDPSYRLIATLEKSDSDKILRINESDGGAKVFVVFGELSFSIANKPYKFLAFSTSEDPKTLFIPFGDATNGNETYGGGRYINIEKTDDQEVTLDFNLAFNPSCVYNDEFICPIPPAQNVLPIGIPVGEKILAKH